LTERYEIVKKVEDRFDQYLTQASTENHMNYNWFGRPSHTEPCAIVDAFMLTTQLWQITGKTKYLEEAHKIYYNGIEHAQRANGGFGLDECTGAKGPFLKMNLDEAWWCCTMRGSEGLVRAVEYSFMQSNDTLILPFFNNANVMFNSGSFKIRTDYPFNDKIIVDVLKAPTAGTKVSFLHPSWSDTVSLTRNGKIMPFSEKDGFFIYDGSIRPDDTFVYTFKQKPYFAGTQNIHSMPGYKKIYYGPLILSANVNESQEITLPKNAKIAWDATSCTANVTEYGIQLHPINDVIDWNYYKDNYCRQILWKTK
jgi:DUF1680 family protein